MNRYLAYYQAQTGSGIQGFRGGVYQSGRGLGSIFRSLLKYVTPILKPLAANLGTEALGMSHSILKDIQGGMEPRPALKRNARVAVANLLNKVVDSSIRPQMGTGRRRRRKVTKKRSIRRPLRKVRKTRRRKKGRKIRKDFLD